MKAVSFNFRFDPSPEETEIIELIVSQKDGEVLLDTLIAARKEHALVVKSVDTKFDVTTVYSDPATSKYSMRTYVQVNPDNWHINERIKLIELGETEPATLYYDNIPYWWDMQFATKQNWDYSARDSEQGAGLIVEYDRLLPTDLVYLLLPYIGEYIFTEVTSPKTHVNFLGASKAVKRKYNRPAGVTEFGSFLNGYTKAGDYSKPMKLYFSYNHPTCSSPQR